MLFFRFFSFPSVFHIGYGRVKGLETAPESVSFNSVTL